jgi:anaerobic magnesium-protoporphyrin IX monomethyl ester cyclase
MARVLLVDPPGWQGAAQGQRPYPNVGIAYLVAHLRAAGHDVSVLDLNNELLSSQEVQNRIDEADPDVVGLSVKTATFKAAQRLFPILRLSAPRASVVAGGPHVTLAPHDAAWHGCCDYLFLGEGEYNFPAFVEASVGKTDPLAVSGVQAAAGQQAELSRPELITDLNTLHFPDYDGFPGAVQASLAQSYPLVTSRGCVFPCTYCSVPKVSGHTIRRRAPALVITELQQARRTYRVSRFDIIDDVFNADIRHAKAFCRALIDAKLDMTWSCPNGIRADCIDPELAELMATSGCELVMVGVESADPAILASVNKRETLDEIAHGIDMLQQAGMQVGGYFIIGLPGDSIEAAQRSVEFARKVGIQGHFNMLVPYPGTAIWEWVSEHGRMLRDITDGTHFLGVNTMPEPVFETADFRASERVRAYELVNTRLRRFDMLLPPPPWGWATRMARWRLILSNDRRSLIGAVRDSVFFRLRAIARSLGIRQR